MPYKKRKGKPSTQKANHKHIYTEYILKVSTSYALGKVCSVCGRQVVTDYFITEKTETGTARLLFDLTDIKRVYPTLSVFNENN